VPVSGPPETAAIEPPVCRPGESDCPLRYSAHRFRDRAASRRFYQFLLPPRHHYSIYISPTSLPQTSTHFLLPFFPYRLPRLMHCSPSKDAVLSDDCPFSVWRRPIPPFSYGVADRSSNGVRHWSCRFLHFGIIHFHFPPWCFRLTYGRI
jgi:hypothetical protein